MIMISSNSIFNFTNFCVVVCFFSLTKLLTSDISFSTAVRAVVVAKLVILGISFLTSFILGLRVVLVAKLVAVLVKVLDSQSRGPKFKTTGWLQGCLSALHPSKVGKISTKSIWELSGKK